MLKNKAISEPQNLEENSNKGNISKEFLTEALKVEATIETPRTKEITSEQLKGLIYKIGEAYKVPNNIAYIGICSTLQAGGSNKNKRSNVKITIQDVAFESKKVNEIIQQQLKITPRQLAKLIANDIFLIAEKHKITGNAYLSLKRFYSELMNDSSHQEKFWAADFQLDNPNCPEYIREALRKRYADKFVNIKNRNK